MSKNSNVFVFKYKVLELSMVEDNDKKDEPEVDWESMGVPGKTPKKKGVVIPGYEGLKVGKSELFWKYKTFRKKDILSIEEFDNNTLIYDGYEKYVIQTSFVEALQIIYGIQLVQTNK